MATVAEAGRGRLPTFWILLAIVALGLFLRLIQVNREDLWSDEGITLAIAHWPLRDLIFRAVDYSPFLYYALVNLFVPDSPSLLEARWLPIMFGLLTIPVAYLLGHRLRDRTTGMFAALLVALSPQLIDYSQEGRPYSLLLLLTLLSALGLQMIARRKQQDRRAIGPLLLFGVANVLACYTHFLSVFWIGPAVLAGREITSRSPNAAMRRDYLVGAGLMALLVIPEVLRTYERLIYPAYDWLPTYGLIDFLKLTGEVLMPVGLWQSRSDIMSSPNAWAMAIAVMVLGWRGWVHWRSIADWARSDPGGSAGIAIFLLIPLVMWAFSTFIAPFLLPRALLIAVPGILIAVAVLDSFERRPIWSPLLALGFAGALFANGTIRERENWRPIVAVLKEQARRDDAIIICGAWHAPSFLPKLEPRPPAPVYWNFSSADPRFEQGLVLGWSPDDPHNSIDALFRSYLEREVGIVIGHPRQKWAEQPAPPASRIWLVRVDCSPARLATIRRWIGASQDRRLIQLPVTPGLLAGPQLWTVEPTRDGPRTAWRRADP